jgi:hypothetical protein
MLRRLAALLAIGVIGITACQAATSPSAAVPVRSSPAVPRTTAEATASTGESAAAEPIPSDELADFSCELPVVRTAEPPLVANIIDVRTGAHDGYDRIVFEFAAGIPEFTLARDEPPFFADGSGAPVNVLGNSFLQLTLRGGTKRTDAGTSSYGGPTEFHPHGRQLVHFIEGGDFEAQSTWYAGLEAEACLRVMTLADPDRLVIDLEH